MQPANATPIVRVRSLACPGHALHPVEVVASFGRRPGVLKTTKSPAMPRRLPFFHRRAGDVVGHKDHPVSTPARWSCCWAKLKFITSPA